MPQQTVAVFSGKNFSASRTEYISRDKITAAEQEEYARAARPLATRLKNSLNQTAATSYLEGEIADNSVSELVISTKLYNSLGKTKAERDYAFKSAVREGLTLLFHDLKLPVAHRYIFAVHKNTDYEHAHVLIARYCEDKNGNKKTFPQRLPKEFFEKNEQGTTRLTNIFQQAFEKRLQQSAPLEKEIESERAGAVPAAADSTGGENLLIENLNIEEQIIRRLRDARTLRFTAEGDPIFVKRNLETGAATSSVTALVEEKKYIQTGDEDEPGFFYTGDLENAKKIALVDSPLEAMALENKLRYRNLSKVAIIALNGRKIEKNLAEFLERKIARAAGDVSFIWARGNISTGNGKWKQKLWGFESFETALKSFSRRAGFGEIVINRFAPTLERSWAREGKLESVAAQVEDEYVKYLQGTVDKYYPTIETEAGEIGKMHQQPVTQISTLAMDSDVADGTRAFELRQKQQRINAAAAQQQKDAGVLREKEKPVRDVERRNQTRQTTDRLKEIPVELVFSRFELVHTRRFGANTWISGDGEHKINVLPGNRFADVAAGKAKRDDGYLPQLSRSNAINAAIYMSGGRMSFLEALNWVRDNFSAGEKPILSKTSGAGKQKLDAPVPIEKPIFDEDKIERVRDYLETTRKISAETISAVERNKTLRADARANAVFILRDFEGRETGFQWRSTATNFRGNTLGTSKDLGCFFIGDPLRAEEIVLTEAPIEALSYYDLQVEKDWSRTAIISLGQATINDEILGKIKALENLRRIDIAFNADEPGQKSARGLAYRLTNELPQIETINQRPQTEEDWNDFLVKSSRAADFLSLENPDDSEQLAAAAEAGEDVFERLLEDEKRFVEENLRFWEKTENESPAKDLLGDPAGQEKEAIGATDQQSALKPNAGEAAAFQVRIGKNEPKNQLTRERLEFLREVFKDNLSELLASHPRRAQLENYQETFIDAALYLATSGGEHPGVLARGVRAENSAKILYRYAAESGTYHKRPEALLIEKTCQVLLPENPAALKDFWAAQPQIEFGGVREQSFLEQGRAHFGTNFSEVQKSEPALSLVEKTSDDSFVTAFLPENQIPLGAETEAEAVSRALVLQKRYQARAAAVNKNGNFAGKEVRRAAVQFSDDGFIELQSIRDSVDGLWKIGYEISDEAFAVEKKLNLLTDGYATREKAFETTRQEIQSKLAPFISSSQSESQPLLRQIQIEFERIKSEPDAENHKLYKIESLREPAAEIVPEVLDELPSPSPRINLETEELTIWKAGSEDILTARFAIESKIVMSSWSADAENFRSEVRAILHETIEDGTPPVFAEHTLSREGIGANRTAALLSAIGELQEAVAEKNKEVSKTKFQPVFDKAEFVLAKEEQSLEKLQEQAARALFLKLQSVKRISGSAVGGFVVRLENDFVWRGKSASEAEAIRTAKEYFTEIEKRAGVLTDAGEYLPETSTKVPLAAGGQSAASFVVVEDPFDHRWRGGFTAQVGSARIAKKVLYDAPAFAEKDELLAFLAKKLELEIENAKMSAGSANAKTYDAVLQQIDEFQRSLLTEAEVAGFGNKELEIKGEKNGQRTKEIIETPGRPALENEDLRRLLSRQTTEDVRREFISAGERTRADGFTKRAAELAADEFLWFAGTPNAEIEPVFFAHLGVAGFFSLATAENAGFGVSEALGEVFAVERASMLDLREKLAVVRANVISRRAAEAVLVEDGFELKEIEAEHFYDALLADFAARDYHQLFALLDDQRRTSVIEKVNNLLTEKGYTGIIAQTDDDEPFDYLVIFDPAAAERISSFNIPDNLPEDVPEFPASIQTKAEDQKEIFADEIPAGEPKLSPNEEIQAVSDEQPAAWFETKKGYEVNRAEFYRVQALVQRARTNTAESFHLLEFLPEARNSSPGTYHIYDGANLKIADLAAPEKAVLVLEARHAELIEEIPKARSAKKEAELENILEEVLQLKEFAAEMRSLGEEFPITLKNINELSLTETCQKLGFDGLKTAAAARIWAAENLLPLGDANHRNQVRAALEAKLQTYDTVLEDYPEMAEIFQTAADSNGQELPAAAVTDQETEETEQAVFYQISGNENTQEQRADLAQIAETINQPEIKIYQNVLGGKPEAVENVLANWTNGRDLEIEKIEDPRANAFWKSQDKEIWQLSPEEFIQEKQQSEIFRYQSAINQAEKQIAETRETGGSQDLLDEIAARVSGWKMRLEQGYPYNAGETEKLNRLYEADVRRAIGKGLVPHERQAELAAISPVFQTAAEMRARYEKNKEQADENQSAAAGQQPIKTAEDAVAVETAATPRRVGTNADDLLTGSETGDAGAIPAGRDAFTEIENSDFGSRENISRIAAERVSGNTGDGTGAGAAAVVAQSAETAAPVAEAENLLPENFRIENLDIHHGGLKTKFKMNVAAVELLKVLDQEGRQATPEEMTILAGFNGWGGMKAAFADAGGWEKEHQTLKAIFSTDESWREAQLSADNAHFTSPEIAQAMWQIIEQLGFTGGRVLEPAVGIGNFLGVMPEGLRECSALTFVEKEEFTARLAAQLYPRATGFQGVGFETVEFQDNYFDLVISNFPFHRIGPADSRYKALNPNLHNYFFLKSLDKTRAGGLVIALTSRYTLDSTTDDRIREALHERADLIAAFRLPETAFQENANTTVVTDLLVFQKRAATTAPERDANWIKSEYHEIPAKDEAGTIKVSINEYFASHFPERVLGEIKAGSMYAGNNLTIRPFVDEKEKSTAEVLRAAANFLTPVYVPQNLIGEVGFAEGSSAMLIESRQAGTLFVENEKIYRINDSAQPIEEIVNQTDFERLTAMLDLRDRLRALYQVELAGSATGGDDAEQENLRLQLNAKYDGFAERFGALKAKPNRAAFGNDPDRYLLHSLEAEYDERTGEVEKAEVFLRPTLSGYQKPEKAETLAQAVAISLNETGMLAIPRLQELLGAESPEKITAALAAASVAFENPATNNWEMRDLYLSGNVREKLKLATETAQISQNMQNRFARNIEALKQVQPRDLDYMEIGVSLGAAWIPPADVKEFLAHLMKTRADNFAVEFTATTGQWQVSWARGAQWMKTTDNAAKIWGTEKADAIKQVQHALDGKPFNITKKEDDADGKTVVVTDWEATDAANQKLTQVKQEFKDWIWTDPLRRARLRDSYNRNINNFVERKFDGSHLTFPGLHLDFELRQHQKDAVWRAMQEDSVYLGHEVGTGKTLVLGAALIEKKRIGQIRKPVLAVMKANVEQITRSLREAYPAAKIFSGEDTLTPDKRKASIAEIAAGNFDLVILTYEQLDTIPLSDQTIAKYITNEIHLIEDAIGAAEEEENNARLVSRLNSRIRSLEKSLELLTAERATDNTLTFEETGIDYLAVDEFHNFKSLPVYSTMGDIKGIPTSRSDRATFMHMRLEHLRQMSGTVRLLAASGTPITNTTAEIYNLMRYTQPAELEARGLQSFDAFARTFIETVTKMEATVTGEYKTKTRLAKYINTPELRALAGKSLDVVSAEEASIVRPRREEYVISSPLSDAQKQFRAELAARAEAIAEGEVEPREDNYLSILNDGRLMSVDMRLVEAEAVDEPLGKINYLVQNVLRITDENPGGTQFIFSNIGVSDKNKAGFSVFNDIEEKLVRGGLPPARIANFGRLSDKARRAAIEKLAAGEILVVIGSTERLGTGVNAQNFAVAAHTYDVPWLPSAVEQRDGRTLRQGNLLGDLGASVKMFRYVTTGSFDEIGWTTIDRKSAFIKQIITNSLGAEREREERDMDDFNAAQIAALASGNPDVLRKLELAEEISALERMERREKQIQLEVADQLPLLRDELEGWQKRLARAQLDSQFIAEQKRADEEENSGKFFIRLDGAEIRSRREAQQIIDRKLATTNRHTVFGEYRGFNLAVAMKQDVVLRERTIPTLALESPVTGQSYEVETSIDTYDLSQGVLPRTLNRIERSRHKTELETSRKRQNIEALEQQSGGEFKFAEKLASLRDEYAEVQTRLLAWQAEEREAAVAIAEVTPISPDASQAEAERIKRVLDERVENPQKIQVARFVSAEHTTEILRAKILGLEMPSAPVLEFTPQEGFAPVLPLAADSPSAQLSLFGDVFDDAAANRSAPQINEARIDYDPLDKDVRRLELLLELSEADGADWKQLLPKAQANFEGKGIVKANAPAFEVVKQIINQANAENLLPHALRTETSGLTVSGDFINIINQKFEDQLAELPAREFAPEMLENFRVIGQELTKASEENSAIIIYVDEVDLNHELFHQAVRLGQRQESAHQDLSVVTEHPVFVQAVENGLERAYDSLDKEVLAEEVAAFLWNNDYNEVGVERADGEQFLETWLTSFAATNGRDSLRYFEERSHEYVENIINRVAGKVTAAGERENLGESNGRTDDSTLRETVSRIKELTAPGEAQTVDSSAEASGNISEGEQVIFGKETKIELFGGAGNSNGVAVVPDEEKRAETNNRNLPQSLREAGFYEALHSAVEIAATNRRTRVDEQRGQIVWVDGDAAMVEMTTAAALRERFYNLAAQKVVPLIEKADELQQSVDEKFRLPLDSLKQIFTDRQYEREMDVHEAVAASLADEREINLEEQKETLLRDVKLGREKAQTGEFVPEKAHELWQQAKEFAVEMRSGESYLTIQEIGKRAFGNSRHTSYGTGRDATAAQLLKREACYAKTREEENELQGKHKRFFVSDEDGNLLSRDEFFTDQKAGEREKDAQKHGWSLTDAAHAAEHLEAEKQMLEFVANQQRAALAGAQTNNKKTEGNVFMPSPGILNLPQNLTEFEERLKFSLNPVAHLEAHPLVQLHRAYQAEQNAWQRLRVTEKRLDKVGKKSELLKEKLQPAVRTEYEAERARLTDQTSYLRDFTMTVQQETAAGKEVLQEKGGQRAGEPIWKQDELELAGEYASAVGSVEGLTSYFKDQINLHNARQDFARRFRESYAKDALEKHDVLIDNKMIEHLFEKNQQPSTLAQKGMLKKESPAHENLTALSAEMEIARAGGEIGEFWQKNKLASGRRGEAVSEQNIFARMLGKREAAAVKLAGLKNWHAQEFKFERKNIPNSSEQEVDLGNAFVEPLRIVRRVDRELLANEEVDYVIVKDLLMKKSQGIVIDKHLDLAQNELTRLRDLSYLQVNRFGSAQNALDSMIKDSMDLQMSASLQGMANRKLLTGGEAGRVMDSLSHISPSPSGRSAFTPEVGVTDIIKKMDHVETGESLKDHATVVEKETVKKAAELKEAERTALERQLVTKRAAAETTGLKKIIGIVAK